MTAATHHDVIVVGGGPAGAAAAAELARLGRRVLLIERGDRIKPCGGAVPPCLLAEFAIPASVLCARVGGARIVSPSGRKVMMAIGDGYVGMVDRKQFDPWLRERAAAAGADVRTGRVEAVAEREDGSVEVAWRSAGKRTCSTARLVIGADGANSVVRRSAFPASEKPPYVFAYHEIVRAPPPGSAGYDARTCDVIYRGEVSPDFYGWVFPHGDTASVGVGSAVKGFDLRRATAAIRQAAGLDHAETLREEGAPIPLRPMRRWDNGRNVLLAGDAAGVVAPASGEGIYYAMLSGRLAAEAAETCLATGRASALASARRRFMRAHGRIFLILRVMQAFWYRNDRRRERFVAICADRDVQRLTWKSYLDKRLVRAEPIAHARIFFKDVAHMMGLLVR
jgi:geranylgeranyl diphosphate/geranylgeranyl-bacteriochlorophyllide a reductase